RLESLGEPAIDLSHKLPGCCPFALLPPQPRQAYSGTQLQRLCLLALSDVKGALEVGFSFHLEGRPAACPATGCTSWQDCSRSRFGTYVRIFPQHELPFRRYNSAA